MAVRFVVLLCTMSLAWSDLLKDHPSKFPGHLEPMAAKQVKRPVESINYFPEPEEFFRDYVDKSRPVLFKGVVLDSPAYKKWTDEFLGTGEEAENATVYVEPGLKENRTNPGGDIPLSDFIKRYHDEEMYLVSGVPTHLMKDVPMPPPLRCEETKELLLDAVTWFSSGGTKSVLHNDDLDNINCLYRGSKDLLFIEYPKYKKQVVLDRPEGGYSALDVEKVDFVKYPGLREVEYIYARMEEGDCLFIPFKWFHQVNSFRNENNKQNLAINVWFTHAHQHQPKTCNVPASEARLSDYQFKDLEKQKYAVDDSKDEEPQSILAQFEELLRYSKTKSLTKRQFRKVLSKSNFLGQPFEKLDLPDSFREILTEMFNHLDKDNSKSINIEDFDLHEKDQDMGVDAKVESNIAQLQDIITDFIEAKEHGVDKEEFEENRDQRLENEAKQKKPLMGSKEPKTEL